MRFDLNHHFDVPIEAVSDAMLDPAFQATVTDIGDLHDRSIIEQAKNPDGGVTRSIRCVLALNVSGMAKSMLGDADPAWVQEERWDTSGTHCDWVIHPEVAAELLSASGTIELATSGEGTTRSVVGEVKVRVPLYGGRVEGWIVDGVTRAYDEEATLLAAWLEREK